MALDLGTLVATMKVDDSDLDAKSKGWSTMGGTVASTFGNLAASGIQAAGQMLGDFVADAMVASDATDKFRKSLEFAGLDTSVIDALTASTQAYADETVYSLTDIQSITATLASNGIAGPDALAKALGNLNAVAGGNAETFGRVGSVLGQTAGAGKLTTDNWNQLAEAIPGASGALMNALLDAGAYTGNFREAMEKGEITAEEFNAAIQKVGTDPVAVEAARSTETFEGAAGNLAATIQGQLVRALEFVKGPFTELQGALAWFIGNTDVLIPTLAGLGTVLLVVLGPAIWAAVVATTAWTVALLANPITWVVLAIGALVAGIVWLIMNWDTAVSFITTIWGGFITWITGVVDGFVGWWGGVWSGISSFFQTVWQGVVDVWTTVWTAIVDFFTPLVEFIAAVIRVYVETWVNIFLVFAAVLTTIWNGIASFLQPVVTAIVGFVSGGINALWVTWQVIWNAVSSFLAGIWNGIVGFVTGAVNTVSGVVNGAVSAIQGVWNSTWSAIGSFLSGIWSGIVSAVRNAVNQVLGVVGGLWGQVMGFFSGAGSWLYNTGRDLILGLGNGIASMAQNVINSISNVVNGAIDWAKKTLGIASPSKLFRSFGVFVGEGLVLGLASMQGAVGDEFQRMLQFPASSVGALSFDSVALNTLTVDSVGVVGSSGESGSTTINNTTKNVTYVATENQSLTAEEALYAALGSPRVKE